MFLANGISSSMNLVIAAAALVVVVLWLSFKVGKNFFTIRGYEVNVADDGISLHNTGRSFNKARA